MAPGVWSSLITRYLRFTARSERELSVHPRCLHSFPSERWTWTSSDRTQVNVYLSPFLSSWEFALLPRQKAPRLSPQCFLASLHSGFGCWATGQLQHCQSERRNRRKTQGTAGVYLHSRGSRLMGSTCGRMCIVNCKERVLRCRLLTFFRKANPNPKCN